MNKGAEGGQEENGHVTARQWTTVAILVYVNLINYMDRLTLAGILTDVQDNFGASDAMMGLLQTSFSFSYMVFAPFFGYVGDRYSRKVIMAGGVFVWVVFTLIGTNNVYFWITNDRFLLNANFITGSFMSGDGRGTCKPDETGCWNNRDYWSFLGCRAMVGIGEASYSTIAPTIISDMFVKDMRSRMLALFYFAIPVGR